MADDGFTRAQLVHHIASIFVSLHAQGLNCVLLIFDAAAEAAILVPPLHYFRIVSAMISNFVDRLDFIARYSRQSGLYHALLGSVVGPSLDKHDLSSVLGIDSRTAKKSIMRVQTNMDHFQRTGTYVPIVQKPVIKRTRISQNLLQRIEAFFHDQAQPSADKTKVKRRKLAKGQYERKPIMYRTSTMPKLLAQYRVSFVAFKRP